MVFQQVDMDVEREGGYVCIAWSGGKIKLTPTAAAKMAHKLQQMAVEIASEVVER